MSVLARGLLVVLVAAAAVLLVPGSSVTVSPTGLAQPASVSARAGGAAAPTSPASSEYSASIQRMMDALNRADVPAGERLLPNAHPDVSVRDGTIHPSYSTLSAPMGLADYGIRNVDGKNVGSISYAQGVEGSLTLNQLNLLYLQSAGPDEYTSQLNAVLVGVKVHGDPNLQFWTQNVIYYFQGTHTLHLADAMVNFSSPSFNFPSNTIIGGHGSVVPGFGYFYPYGPTLTVPEPFTIRFYENPAVVHNEPAIYFNYSITGPTGHTIAGSFDMVEFNATASGIASSPQPKPVYQINGVALGGTGFIPNDVEIMIGGDGGGSPASIFNIDGSMQLFTRANGSRVFAPVPAAYNFATETGETSEGIAEWASGGSTPTAHLGPGPSIQTALWGVAGAPPFGRIVTNFHVNPSNAFAFASPGRSFHSDAAVWAPVPASGNASYSLPPGHYAFHFLLSEYNPMTIRVAGYTTRAVTLTSNPSLGVYTPLWAWDNAQLAAISQAGDGTVNHPYVLFNLVTRPIDPLFGAFNDYLFPVFPGIQLVNTNAYVAVVHAPSFEVSYSLLWESSILVNALPLSNDLAMNFYHASHVSVIAAPAISGWFYAAAFAVANVVFWNSSHNLIAGNTFQTPSQAMLLFGGTDNVIWGNVFAPSLPAARAPGAILNYGFPLALELFESGDLIYNNAFLTPQTAETPAFNLYAFNFVPEVWKDRWNVAMQPASDAPVVNGFRLAGSILGLSYEGGNYWWNYGTASDPYGVLPYNNAGSITYRGDFVPLVPFALYTVTFTEKGLPSGASWSVTFNGITQTTDQTSMAFEEPNGTYPFVVGAISGFTPTPSTGAIVLKGANQAVAIDWT